jgi:hypothetical protein
MATQPASGVVCAATAAARELPRPIFPHKHRPGHATHPKQLCVGRSATDTLPTRGGATPQPSTHCTFGAAFTRPPRLLPAQPSTATTAGGWRWLGAVGSANLSDMTRLTPLPPQPPPRPCPSPPRAHADKSPGASRSLAALRELSGGAGQGLASSWNLGAADFYPATSGKVQYSARSAHGLFVGQSLSIEVCVGPPQPSSGKVGAAPPPLCSAYAAAGILASASALLSSFGAHSSPPPRRPPLWDREPWGPHGPTRIGL